MLLYLDVDNFKEINDTFGHEAGDRVLETLSERLGRILPGESVVGRLAGDEFAVFLPDCDQSRGTEFAALGQPPGRALAMSQVVRSPRYSMIVVPLRILLAANTPRPWISELRTT